MPNITFTILGTPIGFDCIPADRSQHYIQYYDGSTVPEKLVIERNKSRIDYVYLRYGLFSSGGRSGSFIGLALSFEGEYCSTPLLLAELLRSLYAQLLKIGVITQSKTSKGEDLIQYGKQYAQFSTLDSYVKKITSWLNEELREGETFKGSILPLDASFQGEENTQSMKVLRWDNETSAEGVVNAMRRYPYMELRPNATGIEIKVSLEDRSWLQGYPTLLEKSFKELKYKKEAVDTATQQYSLRKEVYKTNAEHVEALKSVLTKVAAALQSLREVASSLQKDEQRITSLREELKKIGEAGVASDAGKSNTERKKECRILLSSVEETETTMLLLLDKYQGQEPRTSPALKPNPRPRPRPKPEPDSFSGGDDPNSDPRKSFFRRSLEWMGSRKKGSLYTLLILLFVGFGVYTYLQFAPKGGSAEDKELRARFDAKKEEIEKAIEALHFSQAQKKMHALKQDITFSNHFSGDIEKLEEEYQTAGNNYYEHLFQKDLDSISNNNVSNIEVLVNRNIQRLGSYKAFGFKNENRNFQEDLENSVITYGNNQIENLSGDNVAKYNWTNRLVQCAKLIGIDTTTWATERNKYKLAPSDSSSGKVQQEKEQAPESNVQGL